MIMDQSAREGSALGDGEQERVFFVKGTGVVGRDEMPLASTKSLNVRLEVVEAIFVVLLD